MSVQVTEKSDYLPSDDLKQAVRLHREGYLDDARWIYSPIFRHNPDNSDSLHSLGVIAHQTGEYDSAIQLISRGIHLTPDQPLYYLNMGNAYRESTL